MSITLENIKEIDLYKHRTSKIKEPKTELVYALITGKAVIEMIEGTYTNSDAWYAAGFTNSEGYQRLGVFVLSHKNFNRIFGNDQKIN